MVEAVKSITASTYSATTGLGIRYLGNWAYAYSGNVLSIGSLAFEEVLSFTTGSGYIMGEVVSYGAVDIANPSQGAHSLTQILLNDLSIGLIKLESGKEGMPTTAVIPILIPPETKVVISIAAESANWNTSASFTGRIYGAE